MIASPWSNTKSYGDVAPSPDPRYPGEWLGYYRLSSGILVPIPFSWRLMAESVETLNRIQMLEH